MEYLNFTKINDDVSIRINRHFTGNGAYSTNSNYFIDYCYSPTQNGNWVWNSVNWMSNSELSDEILLTDEKPKVYFTGHLRMFYPIQFVITGGNVVCDGDVLSISNYKQEAIHTTLGEDRFGKTYVTTSELSDRRVHPVSLYGLFSGCTSLITPPKIECTRVSFGGCAKMFIGCTNLISAPELTSYVIGSGAYSQMFYGCTNISSIACNAFHYEDDSLTDWLYGTNSSGIFYKNNVSTFPSGNNGIPSNWTSEIYEKWNVNSYTSDELDYYRYDIDITPFNLKRYDSDNITFNNNFNNEFSTFLHSIFGLYELGSEKPMCEFFLPGMIKKEIVGTQGAQWSPIPKLNGRRRLYYLDTNFYNGAAASFYNVGMLTEDGFIGLKTTVNLG